MKDIGTRSGRGMMGFGLGGWGRSGGAAAGSYRGRRRHISGYDVDCGGVEAFPSNKTPLQGHTMRARCRNGDATGKGGPPGAVRYR